MRAILEIRAGVGGDDAKQFILEMLRMYDKYCKQEQIKLSLLDVSDSEIICEIDGDIERLVKYESGIHRLQRVPPTESKGRRHTSTITVAVLPINKTQENFNMNDVEVDFIRGQGPGGQHRNTSDTGVRVKHLPTKTIAVCTRGRSQSLNKIKALELLKARVQEKQIDTEKNSRKSNRQKQIGKSGRAEKIRTYNFIENRVKDERVKKAIYKLDKVMEGQLDIIYSKIENCK